MKQNKKDANIALLRIRVLFFYILIIFIIVHLLTSIILSSAGKIMSGKVSSLVAANSRQIELNINDYLRTIESTATLLFSDEAYYKYDPDAPGLSEYDQIKSEEKIADRIVDLGLMQNFTDFTIVYSSGKRVGWTSNTTAGLFDSTVLYEKLTECITNDRTQDGWTFGLGDTTDKLYYIKRINSDAVLLAAFYSRELSSVFEHPAELDGMTISLVNDDNIVLFSSDTDTIAEKLSAETIAILEGTPSEDYITYSNNCENGWRVVCQIPNSMILNEVQSLRQNAILFASVMFALSLFIGIIIISVFMRPVDKAVAVLQDEAQLDALSGLYNKNSFRSAVGNDLTSASDSAAQIFIMIDMDNFKKINDTLGHVYGDQVISRMGGLLASLFDNSYTIGRLGGDEFAMYRSLENSNREDVVLGAEADIRKLFERFDIDFEKERREVGVSLSIGLAVYVRERRFDNLYSAADQALYESKRSGKNRFTLYEAKEEA